MDKGCSIDNIEGRIGERQVIRVSSVKLNATVSGIACAISCGCAMVREDTPCCTEIGTASQYTLETQVCKHDIGPTHCKVELFARTSCTYKKNLFAREIT